jgi:hydroxyethylthiazole kinase-like uncharacterized protein yjeF
VAGALRSGSGYVRVAAEPGVAEAVRLAWPEAVVSIVSGSTPTSDVGRVQAWVAGPGLGLDGLTGSRLIDLLDSGLPLLLDADALTVVSRDPSLLVGRDPATTLLTPHAGELARMLGVDRPTVEARRLEHVREAASRFSATVLLKGATTLVASPGRPVRVVATGPAELATAGAGDVLAGVGGTLLASGLPAWEAGSLAAWVHGTAARSASAGGPLVASDVAEQMPATLADLRRPPGRA